MHSKTAQRTKGSLAPLSSRFPPTYRKLVDTTLDTHVQRMHTSGICDCHNGFFFTEPSTSLFRSKENVSATHKLQTKSLCKKDSRFERMQCVEARFKAQVLLKQSTYYLWKCTLKINSHTHTRIDIQHINRQGSPTHITDTQHINAQGSPTHII